MKKTTVSVLGCCVSRDIFEIVYPDKYDIERTLGLFSPISMVMPKGKDSPVLTMKDIELPGGGGGISNYLKRCFLLDYNKSAFSYLSEVQSDWLVLDIGHSRLDLITFDNDPETIFSRIFSLSSLYEYLGKKMGKKQLFRHPWDLSDEQISRYLNIYLDEILKLYPQEKIVFVDVYCVNDYITKDGAIAKFKNCEIFNSLNSVIKKCSDIVKKRFPNCHRISFPRNVVANENHKWGIHHLHYDTIYYEYAAKAFDLINERKPREQENFELNILCAECFMQFAKLRESKSKE